MKFEPKGNSITLTDQSLMASTTPQSNSSTTSIEEIQKHRRKQSSTSNIDKSTIEMNPPVDVKQYKPNMSLPYIYLNITATLSNNQILILITQIFEKIHYKKLCSIKETHQERVCVYEYKGKGCLKRLFKKKKPKSQFHVNVVLDNSNSLNDTYERRLIIRTINGEEKEMVKKITQFIKQLCSSLTKIKILKQSKVFNSLNLSKYIELLMQDKKRILYKNQNIPMNRDYTISFTKSNKGYKELTETESSIVENSNNEAGKIYDIYKILSREEYSLSKSINAFINEFKTKYSKAENIINIKPRYIMKEVVNEIEECVKIFNTSFNNTELRGEDSKNGSFIRQATEMYIFNKIYFILIEIYKLKYKEQNDKYLSQKNKINKTLDVEGVFKHLEIKKKFRGDDSIPFKVSIDLINKMEFEQLPRKKFENLIQSNLEMRNSILSSSQGKHELDSMDDELPLIIYLATQVRINNFPAELNLVDDYLKSTIRDDLIQNKMLMNLQSSVLYITNSWNSDDK